MWGKIMGNTDRIAGKRRPEVFPAGVRPVLERVAREHGTPAYVYFQRGLQDSMQQFLNIPAPRGGLIVRYAMKANPHSAILSLFSGQNGMGAHLDASTFNEVYRAIEGPARIPGYKIRLTSEEVLYPGKRHPGDIEDKIGYLADHDVLYSASSLAQLRTYGEARPGTEVGIRFNIDFGSGGNSHTETGGPNSPFGIHGHRDDINELLKRHRLSLNTVHVHIGSGSDPEKQKEATREALAIVDQYSTVERLDMGGGFKVARMSYEKGTDVPLLGEAMTATVTEFEERTGKNLLLEIEPGTGATATAGYVIARIIDVKDTQGPKGQNFINIDAGMNVISRTVLYGAEHPQVVFPQDCSERGVVEYLVFGPCCETGDAQTLEPGDPNKLKPRPLTEAREKDLMGIGGTGAYCASMALQNYNSLERPPEIWVGLDGEITVITPRQNIVEVWSKETVPALRRGRLL